MQNYMQKRNAGYTIDQTILIVAIIAILITLIIGTVGWDLINRTGGAKLAAQLRQIEDANGQFFAQHQLWPHQSLIASATPDQNNTMSVLRNSDSISASLVPSIENPRNFLPGFQEVGGVTNHNFGGGAVNMLPNVPVASMGLGTNQYMVVQFVDVPFEEAVEADRAVDGTEAYDEGRIVYNAAGSACLNTTLNGTMSLDGSAPTSGRVDLCYVANLIQ